MTDELHTGVVRVTRAALHSLLKLPDSVVVGAVHFDPFSDCVCIRVDSDALPPVRHRPLPFVHLQYESRPAALGEQVVELKAIEMHGAAVIRL